MNMERIRIIAALSQGAILAFILIRFFKLKGLELIGILGVLLLLIIFIEERFIYPKIFKEHE